MIVVLVNWCGEKLRVQLGGGRNAWIVDYAVATGWAIYAA